MHAIPSEFLGEALAELRKYKQLAERAMAQVSDEDLVRALDPEGNSIAMLIKHMRGNMLSRWRDFLASDGEKADRDRDSEFVADSEVSRDRMLQMWEEGWAQVFSSLEALRPTDLERTVTIRGEPMSALQAILRQLTHYASHVGQIILLAKHFRGDDWESLSIPRKK
jgi:endonuclease III-like uncharacterized protein